MTEPTRTRRYGDERDYPYDPRLSPWRINQADGLDRLRYIADRGLAQSMYILYFAAYENERTGSATRFERQAEADALERDNAFATAALEGKHGREIQGLAEHMLIDNNKHTRSVKRDRKSLTEFRDAVRRFRGES